VQVAQKLVEHGGDVNLMNDHKLTALHMAFMGGHHDCVKLLMERSDPASSPSTARARTRTHARSRTDTRTYALTDRADRCIPPLSPSSAPLLPPKKPSARPKRRCTSRAHIARRDAHGAPAQHGPAG
jgi:ankyrin repeat protein